jgi:hypothetical protein
VSGTSLAERTQLLAKFRDPSNDAKLCVLTSVHILDEGIDEPSCDSTFFGALCIDANAIRAMQRLMRGSRLDAARPSKLNHAFIFADSDGCGGALELLKDADPTFSSRIRVIGSSYDAQRSPATLHALEMCAPATHQCSLYFGTGAVGTEAAALAHSL